MEVVVGAPFGGCGEALVSNHGMICYELMHKNKDHKSESDHFILKKIEMYPLDLMLCGNIYIGAYPKLHQIGVVK